MDIECRNFASISVGDLQVFHTVDIHVRGVGQSPSLSRTAVEAQYPLASSVFHSHATDMSFVSVCLQSKICTNADLIWQQSHECKVFNDGGDDEQGNAWLSGSATR